MKIYIVVAMTRSRIYNDVMHSITALCFDRKTAKEICDAKNARTPKKNRAYWREYIIKTKSMK